MRPANIAKREVELPAAVAAVAEPALPIQGPALARATGERCALSGGDESWMN